jgi:hypothetical protein
MRPQRYLVSCTGAFSFNVTVGRLEGGFQQPLREMLSKSSDSRAKQFEEAKSVIFTAQGYRAG